MDLEEFYSSLHANELARRDTINRGVSIPSATLALLGGALFRAVTERPSPHNEIDALILASSVGLAFLLIWVLYDIVKVATGYSYALPATAKGWYDFYTNVCKEKYPIEADALLALAQSVKREHIRCATHNALRNDTREEILSRARRNLGFLLFGVLGLYALVAIEKLFVLVN